ncbi:hypothetical protein [Legionella impletisoli]|uniref:Uncharacterized protein n=1 Tax=Legionella impletisoli TaxID=343510 RepID=A0A917JT28_9GAMM|nr:hypothetical protein [Legionella impletisoli]GGI85571.1 hypothetical protein GCM10007966_12710 [Legionella impletisoli]
MKRILAGLSGLVLILGLNSVAFAAGEIYLLLETDSGTKIKVQVPEDEQHKLKELKSGEMVKLWQREGGYPDVDIEIK